MSNFCSACGGKVEKDFSYCPNCGTEINLDSQFSPSSLNDPTLKPKEVLICATCGDENSLEDTICHSCGVRLDKTKRLTTFTVNKNKEANQLSDEKSNIEKRGKSKNKNKIQSSATVKKKLDNKKILTLAVSILAIVVLIFIASGVINISGEDNIETVSNQQNQASGVDLNSINKINELRNIVEKNPENESAILELANLLFDSGFFEEAKNNYEHYLKFDTKNADARIDLGVCYYNLQQFDKAESEILTALKYAPKHQTAYLNLGIINLSIQKIEKSKEWFNKAYELDPNSEIGKKAKSLLQSH
jgi:tetratricopeptide (TPR) repeat protein